MTVTEELDIDEEEDEKLETVEEMVDATEIFDQIEEAKKTADDNSVEIDELRGKISRLEKKNTLLEKKLEHQQQMVDGYEKMIMDIKKRDGDHLTITRAELLPLVAQHLTDSFAQVHAQTRPRTTKVIKTQKPM
jgi:chromosome segregation ATPase